LELLGELLRESADKIGLNQILEAEKLLRNWALIVGEQIAKNAQPAIIKNKTLVISTTNPAWSYQLTMLKPQLLKKMRTAGLDVEEIVFRASVPPKKKEEKIEFPTITEPPNYQGLPTEVKPDLRRAMALFVSARQAKNNREPLVCDKMKSKTTPEKEDF
jgi:hypothetical protein